MPSSKGYIEYPGESYHKSTRRPGGKFPEGWEFFKPAYGVLWFVRPICTRGRSECETSKPNSKNTKMYKILGLCPIKSPLDSCFDKMRQDSAAKNQQEPTGDENNHSDQSSNKQTSVTSMDATSGELDLSEDMRNQERNRTSKARYHSSWDPAEIPQLLENAWIQKEPVDCENKEGIRTPRRRPVVDIVAVINLCATDRYYNKESFLKKGLAFSYLRVEGGNRVPSKEETSKLEQVWDELFDQFAITEESCDLDQLLLNRWGYQWPIVLIHCTHGVNRTGYCANYLMLKHSKDLAVKESLKLFHLARGHGINKDELCQALYERFEQKESQIKKSPRRGSGLVVLG